MTPEIKAILNSVHEHCREEGFDYPTVAAFNRATLVIKSLHNISVDYVMDVYPMESRDVIVDCGVDKARHIFHCFPNGAVIGTGVVDGKIEAKHILNSDDVVSFIDGLDINKAKV